MRREERGEEGRKELMKKEVDSVSPISKIVEEGETLEQSDGENKKSIETNKDAKELNKDEIIMQKSKTRRRRKKQANSASSSEGDGNENI